MTTSQQRLPIGGKRPRGEVVSKGHVDDPSRGQPREPTKRTLRDYIGGGTVRVPPLTSLSRVPRSV